MTTLKPIPRQSGRVVIPWHRRAPALAGIALYAPTTRRSTLVRDLLWYGVRLFGPRVVWTRAVPWEPPFAEDVWSAVQDDVSGMVGRWDAVAVHRRSADRPGATIVFIAGGRQVAIVRIEPMDACGIEREAEALRRVEAFNPETFTAPRVLGLGTCAGWAWEVQAPLALGRHRPAGARVPLARIVDELQAALATLPRDARTPDRWRPFHGDFVPWNLRTTEHRTPALLDWEASAWAPDGADLFLYAASAAAVGRPRASVRQPSQEVVDFWRAEIERRVSRSRERGLTPDPLNHELLRYVATAGNEE